MNLRNKPQEPFNRAFLESEHNRQVYLVCYVLTLIKVLLNGCFAGRGRAHSVLLPVAEGKATVLTSSQESQNLNWYNESFCMYQTA